MRQNLASMYGLLLCFDNKFGEFSK